MKGTPLYACPVCPETKDEATGEKVKAQHPSSARIASIPVLMCPTAQGDVLRFRDGWTVLVTGMPKDKETGKPKDR